MEEAGDGGPDRGVLRPVGGAGGSAIIRGRGGETARQDWAVAGGTGFFSESLRSMSVERRRQMIEPEHPRLSVVRQCALVSISRSGFYYQPAGETSLNLALIRLITDHFLPTPCYRPP